MNMRKANKFSLVALTVVFALSLGFLASCERAAPPPPVIDWDGEIVTSVIRDDMYNPYALVDVPLLLEMMDMPNVVILDVSPNRNNVIPGAIWLDRTTLLRDFEGNANATQPIDVSAHIFGANGIGNDTTVIVYDDANGMHAARIFWLLRAMGHRDVRLLDGGLRAWQDSGQRLQAVSSAPNPTVTFTAVDNMEHHRADLDFVVYAKNSPNWSILDTRSPAEIAAGRIPGSIPFSFIGDFVNADFTFRTLAEYEETFSHIPRDTGLIVSCGSGLRSSVAYFVFRDILNWPQPVKNYEGGWNNWTWAGMPVEN